MGMGDLKTLYVSIDGQQFVRLAAFFNEEYVGTCDLRVLDGYASFRQLFVRAGYRRRGIGTFLLANALNLAAINKCALIGCEVKKCNSDALAFYTRHGFFINGENDHETWIIAREVNVSDNISRSQEAARS